MKRVILLAVVIWLSGFGLVTQAQNVGSSGDEDAIRRVVVAMTEGFNHRDGKAAAQMYEPDARFVTVRGEVMSGQPAIEKGLASILSGRAKKRFPADARCCRQIPPTGRRASPRDQRAEWARRA